MKNNFKKIYPSIFILLVLFVLPGCATLLNEIGEGIGVYTRYYIMPPIFESINIMTLVYAREKELQIEQSEANIQNIIIAFNSSRIDELVLSGESESEERSYPVTSNNIKFSIKSMDKHVSLDQREYIGKFELTIEDGKKVEKKIYQVGYFKDEYKDAPSAKATFDIYVGDIKQKQEVIYFNKINDRWLELEVE